MKKAIAFILIAIIVAIPAVCEFLNLTELNTEELLQLKREVDTELASRQSKLIYPGTYTIGKNIEPGDYVMSFVQSEKDNSKPIMVYVFSSEEDKKEGKPLSSAYTRPDDIPFFVSLPEEGGIVTVDWGILSAVPAN